MAALLATITAAAQDIKTAELLTTTYTADAARWVMLQVRVTNLLNTAATVTARLRHLTAADAVLAPDYDTCALAKSTATNTTWGCRPLGPLYLAAGEKAQVGLFSTNAGDSGVTYTIKVLDAESGAADAATAATNSASIVALLPNSTIAAADDLPSVPTAAEIAAEILATPANKLATGADGSVTASNAGAVDEAAIAGAVRTELTTELDEIGAIKAKTDGLNFTGTDVKATLDGETVTVATNNDKTGYALTSAYDAAKTAGATKAELDAAIASLPAAIRLNLAAELARIDVAVSTRATLGAGSVSKTYTLTSDSGGLPIADAAVWVSTDSAGANIVAAGRTDQNGEVAFQLNAGTVYVWRFKSGFTFTNPDTEVVA